MQGPAKARSRGAAEGAFLARDAPRRAPSYPSTRGKQPDPGRQGSASLVLKGPRVATYLRSCRQKEQISVTLVADSREQGPIFTPLPPCLRSRARSRACPATATSAPPPLARVLRGCRVHALLPRLHAGPE